MCIAYWAIQLRWDIMYTYVCNGAATDCPTSMYYDM